MLVSWGARAMYIGPSLALPAHRNAVAVLAIALDGTLEVACDPRDPARGYRTCRSALIEPNALHQLKAAGSATAFIYVDAMSDDLAVLRAGCGERGRRVSFGVSNEGALVDLLATMERCEAGWLAARATLAGLLRLDSGGGSGDQRMRCVVQDLLDDPGQAGGALQLAARVGLSSSRFQHLFKQETGVPFRRFRLWARMRRALAGVMAGASLTSAAHDAGFASSAHLSTAFRDMFGMPPSALLAGLPILVASNSNN